MFEDIDQQVMLIYREALMIDEVQVRKLIAAYDAGDQIAFVMAWHASFSAEHSAHEQRLISAAADCSTRIFERIDPSHKNFDAGAQGHFYHVLVGAGLARVGIGLDAEQRALLGSPWATVMNPRGVA